ncbi:uncharacterized protein EMH_0041710 [Eimeria mitis]|uniref:Uncharacterized protein n=1 Tax=Eimeria mitis TaxID=44415 RepID=U6JUV3_9EIME|nr:uncharacterized protein EMH_0041710 [Eimeria mitis]CDJ28541.1 hypothetical protein, conserved [Eimeria mitis]
MIRGQPDKRGDGDAGSSPSPSRSKRRTGRDAAAWNDPELFGGGEEEEDRYDSDRGDAHRHSGKPDKVTSTDEKWSAAAWNDPELFGGGEEEEDRYDSDRGDAHRHSGKPDKVTSTDEKWRRPSTFSGSEASDQEGKENAADTATAAAAADNRRTQRRTRQPPLSAASFLQSPEGAPADGLLSLYCNINYARDKLHKFKFFDRNAAREARKREYRKELKAAQALLALNARQPQRQKQTQELLQAEITVRSRRRLLARLEGEERLELREDLNTLMREIREGIVAFYPYNEHISRLARRLDKISAQPDMWAQYRPRLVQLHLSGFLNKWMDRGCPPDPYEMLQKQSRGDTATTAAAGEAAETGGPSYMEEDVGGPPDIPLEEEYPFPDEPWAQREPQTNSTEATKTAAPAQPNIEKAAAAAAGEAAETGGPSYMEEDIGGAPDIPLEEEYPFPDEAWAQREPQTNSTEATKTAAPAQPNIEKAAAGPSEEELKELRQKQMEAKARREKLRAAQRQQQTV